MLSYGLITIVQTVGCMTSTILTGPLVHVHQRRKSQVKGLILWKYGLPCKSLIEALMHGVPINHEWQVKVWSPDHISKKRSNLILPLFVCFIFIQFNLTVIFLHYFNLGCFTHCKIWRVNIDIKYMDSKYFDSKY